MVDSFAGLGAFVTSLMDCPYQESITVQHRSNLFMYLRRVCQLNIEEVLEHVRTIWEGGQAHLFNMI